jgi:hypothetical protein
VGPVTELGPRADQMIWTLDIAVVGDGPTGEATDRAAAQ